MRNGQITIFAIIAIMILVIGFVYLYKPAIHPQPPTDDYRPTIQHLGDGCVQQGLEDALFVLSKQGLLYGNDFVYTNESDVAVYFSQGISRLPALTEFENQIAGSIEDSMQDCIGLQEEMINPLLKILTGTPHATVTITDEYINAVLTMPIQYQQGTETVELSRFVAMQEYPLGIFHTAASAILPLLTKQTLDLTALSHQEVIVDLLVLDPSTLVVTLTDGGTDHALSFAIQY